ncbi:ABC transporter substrate-binding protein [Bradyrhizobium sp. CSA207]|uniref:ABC transporter substrate-binding protein n=1 Tax=Bradyrhizobium sp. CSA207 TaxID=2698826 RepID=UPI0023B0C607|nr:ABC transporter substrate-binding protein [Bradyrhizobium sp. CSA207]MDE5444359.1 ABC transporter substrate-binding protein [Bradyrhizobium sp. CSA207]
MVVSFEGCTRIGLAVAIGIATLSNVTVYAQEKRAIKIGLMLPYKGVYALPTESIDRGFQLALEEFGNKANGHPVEIVRADDELTPNVGVQKFNKFVQSDKVDLVAGVVGSNVGIAISELADKNKMPMVFVNAFADEITGKFCSPYIARTSFSANAFEYASGKYWASKGIKTAVTMGPDYSAGRAFIGGFRRGFEDNGGKVIEELWTPFQKTKDYSAALTQAANSGAQIIYAFYAGAEAIQVVKQHADFGLRSKIPLIGDHWVYDEALWPALGDLALNAQHVATHYPGIQSEANEKFVKAYAARYKQTPDVSAELGYDNGKAIMLTLESLGGQMPEDRTKFISTMRDLTFDAPRGKIKFNAQNSALLEKVYVIEIVKGPDGTLQRKSLDEFPGAGDLPGCTKSF